MNKKECPYCFETIDKRAVKCPYCRSDLIKKQGFLQSDLGAIILIVLFILLVLFLVSLLPSPKYWTI